MRKSATKHYQTKFNNYKNNHTSRSSGIYFTDAKMVQYLQTNECDIPH